MPTNSKFKTLIKKWQKQIQAFLRRRPHRSFRLSRRRDYVRPLHLPGYTAVSIEVTRTLWRQRRIFLPLMLIYLALYALLIGVGSQDSYEELKGFFTENGGDLFSGGFGAITQAGVTLFTLVSSGLQAEPSEAQQIFSVILGLLAWLTTVWLLRNILAGHKVKLRDGLYNAGAPLLATLIISGVIALQLLPVALAALGYSAATTSGLITGGGVPAMLFWSAAVLLGILSLYWITSSLFAMVVITLPGMYPYKALKTAGDIVLGRRLTLLFRWLWMFLSVAIIWIVWMIPIILIDMGVKSLWPGVAWLPVVPVALLLVSTYSVFWSSSYIYILYRKVVTDESA